MVFFEAPHRIVASLQSLCEVLGGERQATLARELTKQFETVLHADLQTLHTRVRDDPDQQRGEFVIVVAGAAPDERPEHDAHTMLAILLEELPPTKAARIAARLTGQSRKALYEQALRIGHKKS